MTSGDPCPRCGEDIILVDVTEAEWSLDPAEYQEDDEAWLCTNCGWNEVADPDEALDEHVANLEWAMSRVSQSSSEARS